MLLWQPVTGSAYIWCWPNWSEAGLAGYHLSRAGQCSSETGSTLRWRELHNRFGQVDEPELVNTHPTQTHTTWGISSLIPACGLHIMFPPFRSNSMLRAQAWSDSVTQCVYTNIIETTASLCDTQVRSPTKHTISSNELAEDHPVTWTLHMHCAVRDQQQLPVFNCFVMFNKWVHRTVLLNSWITG